MRPHPRAALSLLALLLFATAARPQKAEAPALLTVAEKSGYKATSRHAEVVDFCDRLAKLSPLVRLGELGKSGEGRKLPLVILADPPVRTPEGACFQVLQASLRHLAHDTGAMTAERFRQWRQVLAGLDEAERVALAWLREGRSAAPPRRRPGVGGLLAGLLRRAGRLLSRGRRH